MNTSQGDSRSLPPMPAIQPTGRIHHLKTWPEQFAAVRGGLKTHEVRKFDRNFHVGDLLVLKEFEPHHLAGEEPEECKLRGCPTGGYFTGAEIHVRVTHITPGGAFGLPEGLCVMSVRRVL